MSTIKSDYKKMKWINLIAGLLYIAGIFGAFFYNRVYEDTNYLIFFGFLWIFLPILIVLPRALFIGSQGSKDIVELHNALISRQLKHYDIGSKFLVISTFLTQLFGIGLVIFGLIK